MSKIDDLIAEMCLDGVPLIKLGDLEDQGIVKLGRGDVISKTDLRDTPGEYPVYSSSAASDGLFGKYGQYMFNDEKITWSIDGGGKFFYRKKHKFSVTNVCGWMKVLKSESVSTRYLYYVLISIWGGRTYNYTVKAHPSVIREDYFIPLPPLEIQKEIVAILDQFTELEAELVAELEARKIQYEFNRNLLLTFNEGEVPSYSLGEIGQIISGLRGKTKSDFTAGNAPYVSYVDISNNPALNFEVQKLVKVDKNESQNEIRLGDVLITGSSETKIDVGLTSVVTIEPRIKTYIKSFCFIWRPHKDIEILPEFSKHLFRGKEFRDKVIETANGVTRLNISKPKLLAINIPVPPLKIQKEIVEILNNFDSLANDISVGIPAEINARRQQYEYYRNKLLTFKELDVA